jgi:hypothetical protein
MIAALYVREDTIYRSFDNVDCYPESRDALNYAGPFPVIAHPPCRGWGQFYKFSKAPAWEFMTGIHAVGCVQMFGGILEHPEKSKLWKECGIPKPGERADRFGGSTIEIDQVHWGHPCRKRTWLYHVGGKLPAFPVFDKKPTHVINSSRGSRERGDRLIESNHKMREITPRSLAEWLIEYARSV